MAFRDDLDYWELSGSFAGDTTGRAGLLLHRRGPVRGLGRRGPGRAGSAVLVQTIYADDYCGRTVTFRGQLRTTGMADQAGLRVAVERAEVRAAWRPPARSRQQQPDLAGQQRLDLA